MQLILIAIFIAGLICGILFERWLTRHSYWTAKIKETAEDNIPPEIGCLFKRR